MEWVKIVNLNNTNYQAWSFSVKALMHLEPVAALIPITDNTRNADKKTFATNTIHLMVDESQYGLIRTETTAADMWSALKQHHEKKTTLRSDTFSSNRKPELQGR